MVASPVTDSRPHNRCDEGISMVFLLAASVRSVSWLCDSKRSYFGSTRSSVVLAVLLLSSTIMSGCLGGDDWNESELDFQYYREYERYICYDGIAIWDCYDFPEDIEAKSSERHIFSSTNGDFLKLTLTSHEDSSGMAIVTVTTQDTSDDFKLRSGNTESGIFKISGVDQYLEVHLEADNGWFGDIVHYTIEVSRDTTYRDTDLDGYIDTMDYCTFSNGNSSIAHFGCPDNDGDGWSDFDEYDCGTQYLVENHTPLDNDNDAICNYLDEDDDGDGWTDTEELSCGADPLSANSVPIVNNDSEECHAILLDVEGYWESTLKRISAIVIIFGTLAMAGRHRRSDFHLKGPRSEYSVPEPEGPKRFKRLEPVHVAEGTIGVFRKDVNQAVWVNAQNGQTIGDAVASSGLVGRDGTPWSIHNQSGNTVDKGDPATNFWSQNVSVVFR